MRNHFLRTIPKGIQFVGAATGKTTVSTGTASAFDFSLTSLTGGIDTRPRSGDLILGMNAICTGSTNTASFTGPLESYTTLLASTFSNDTNDTNMFLAYRISTGTETTARIAIQGSGTDGNAASIGIAYVFRGVNTTTPIDVTRTVAIGGNTGRPDVPSITPVTAGAVIVGFGAGSLGGGLSANLTASGVSNVVTVNQNAEFYGAAGIAASYIGWTSGAYDMAAFGGGSNLNTQSWVAAAVAIRPK